MSRIKILPEILSNKIAAGEVVERPASVVKELVENALDAEADQLIIDIGHGGRSLIRVADNGCGMSHDDALLALERFATSKIQSDADLVAIRTLGFRGEALPSIASVSDFELITRDAGSDAGISIMVQGGKIRDVVETGAPTGTMITVRKLFYNIPARRKFLKTVATEMGHVADTVARMALCRPGVSLRLSHDGKPYKDWPACTDQHDRILDVLGRELAEDLVPVSCRHADIALDGWISTPRVQRSSSKNIYLFVNDRFVKDRTIQHALFAGYQPRLMKGRFPVAVLFVKVPWDQVDVNVHPTKHEVRFVRQKSVHDQVARAVADRLRELDRPAWSPRADTTQSSPPPAAPSQDQHPPEKVHVAETKAPFVPPRPKQQPVFESLSEAPRPPTAPLARLPIPANPPADPPAAPQDGGFAGLRPIGQLFDTYVLCEGDETLVLIDHHAAHERIVFEQLKERIRTHQPSSQKLLTPEPFDTTHHQARILTHLMPELKTMGIEIEPFGGTTFVITAVPSRLSDQDVRPLLRDILEKATDSGIGADPAALLDECLAVAACHMAIRAHQQLTPTEIRALLTDLDACRNPSACPHGRPTWVRLDKRFFDKSFRRII